MPAKRKSTGGNDKGPKEKASKVAGSKKVSAQEQPYITECVAWFLGCYLGCLFVKFASSACGDVAAIDRFE